MSILTDLAEGGAKGLFSGIGDLAKDIRTAITGKDPSKEAEIQVKLMEIELAASNAQMQLNMVEAQSESLFKSGWRPAVGWVCVFALAWYYILAPLFTWFLTAFKIEMAIPVFDTGELMTLLFAMLGFGGMRSFDKKK